MLQLLVFSDDYRLKQKCPIAHIAHHTYRSYLENVHTLRKTSSSAFIRLNLY